MTQQRAYRLSRTLYVSSVWLMTSLILLGVGMVTENQTWAAVSYVFVLFFSLLGGIAFAMYENADALNKEKINV